MSCLDNINISKQPHVVNNLHFVHLEKMELFGKSLIIKELNSFYLKKENPIDDDQSNSSTSSSTKSESSFSSISEMSYELTYNRDDIINGFLLLCTLEPWIFIVVLSISFILWIQTFWIAFGFEDCAFWIYIGLTLSDIIYFIDLMSLISNSMLFPKFIMKQGLPSVNKAKVFVDCATFIPIILDNYFYDIMSMSVRKILLGFIIIRCYRVLGYLSLLSKKAGLNMMYSMTKKIFIVYMFVIHPLSCWWYTLIFDDSINWSTIFKPINVIQPNSSYQWYIISTYYIHQTITKICFGDIISVNPKEQFVTIITVWLGFIIIQGLFLSEWQSVQIEKQRRQVEFYLKIRLINNDLANDKRISKAIQNRILGYYLLYWRLQSSIINLELFKILPKSMVQNILLDHYWIALKCSFIFQDLNDALRRDIASLMETRIYQPDDIIFTHKTIRKHILFIIKGSIQLLAAMDDESPILTLGAGTVLNEIGMVLTCCSTIHVKAYTVCVIHKLSKSSLWHAVQYYKNLEQGKLIHKRITKKLQHAKSVHQYGRFDTTTTVPALKTFKKALRTNAQTFNIDELKMSAASSHNMMGRSQSSMHKLSGLTLKVTGTYIYSKIFRQHSDDICLTTTWPFILQPQSSLLLLWETTICTFAFSEGIIIPYYATLVRYNPKSLLVFYYLTTLAYILDLLVQISTAVEGDQETITTITGITAARLKTVRFILDIISIVPIDSIMYILYLDMNERFATILKFNRLVKFNRIFNIFERLEHKLDINFVVIRLIKYTFTFIISVYWTGMLYYLLSCYNIVCDKHSWLSIRTETELGKLVHLIVYSSTIIISGVGFGDNSAQNFKEMLLLHVYFFIGLMLFSYLVSDYSAILVLTNNRRTTYQEIISVLSNFFYINKTPTRLAHRIFSFLSLQWQIQEGYSILSDDILLVDAPEPLIEAAQSARCLAYFKACPLFMDINDSVLTELVKRATFVCICPDEIIVKAGDITKCCYFIDEGYAEVKSVITGQVEEIKGPGDSIGAFEMVVEQSIICNVRSLTYIKMYVLSTETVYFVFMSDHTVYNDTQTFVKAAKGSMALQEIANKAKEIEIPDIIKPKPSSWFKFNKKLRKSYHDYMKPYRKLGIFSAVRFFLLSRTIIPDGKFMLYWEIQRAILSFIGCLLFPALTLIGSQFSFIYYVSKILDIISYIDIYIRLHVGYYTERGMLISHPLYTAKYYISHAMLIDLMGCLPFEVILRQISTDHTEGNIITKYHTICSMFRLLQVYRITSIFHYYEGDILNTGNIFIMIIKYFAISSVFFNIFAVLSITTGAELTKYADGTVKIHPFPNKWISRAYNDKSYNFNILNPINLLIVAWYWIVHATMTNGIGDIIPQSGKMMFYLIIFIIWGYLWFTYMLVILSLTINVNVNQTLYQEGMRKLLKFMQIDLVAKELREEVIAHLEYVWQRDRGVFPTKIIKKCSVTLRQDYQLFFYEQVFEMVPIFNDASRTFLQQLANEIKESYCLSKHNVIRCNDLVSFVYIIFKGVLEVYGPDGAFIDYLGPGSLFGNLDDIDITRSMISAYATCHFDYLKVSTKQFYALTSKYAPNIRRKLQRHFLLKNMSYLKSSYEHVVELEESTKSIENILVQEKRITSALHPESRLILIIAIMTSIASYLSCIQIFALLAYEHHTFVNYLIIYVCDILMICRFITLFWTPYIDEESGILITNKKDIRKRLIHYQQIIENITCLFPYEIFSIVFTTDRIYYAMFLRLNRVARVIYIFRFFNSKMDRLNVNILLIKTSSIIIYISLLIHIYSCLWWISGCPRNVCPSKKWLRINQTRTPELCEIHEYCATYFITMGINVCWQGDITPAYIHLMLLMILLTLIQQYLMAYFLSETLAVVKNYTQTLIEFDDNLRILLKYMKLNGISRYLQIEVEKYSCLLWEVEEGCQIPKMLQLLPNTLKEKVKWSAYGKHLSENFVFTACHPDFLRQVAFHLQRWSYFKDGFIVRQGDVNNTMYFIQRGTVSVINETKLVGSDKYIYDVLNDRDCFGLVQGLFPLIPHDYTFRADNHVVVLSLKLEDWSYMLNFFPASEISIYERMHYVKQRLFPDANYINL